MKICIPTETNEGKNAVIFGHFGSAPYFTIVNTEKDSIEIINNANQHHSHGMCQPMSALMGKQIDAVVTGGMGGRAVQKLNEGGIKAYRAIPGTVRILSANSSKADLKK
jgi:predicted Fe-Mo cluster-binding NifX family protein